MSNEDYTFTRDDELKTIKWRLEDIFTPKHVEKIMSTVEEVWDNPEDNSETLFLPTLFNTQGHPTGDKDYCTMFDIKLVLGKHNPSKILTPEEKAELRKKYKR